jgi:hypothetical protein
MALPYNSRVVRTQLFRPAASTIFKLYFVNITGRAQQEKYEWEYAAYGIDTFLADLAGRNLQGVGFITAFPHITKVFRFGPKPETNLHAAAFATSMWEKIALERNGWCEVACAAEMEIAADEFNYWAVARDVEEYAAKMSSRGAVSIVEPGKLEKSGI